MKYKNEEFYKVIIEEFAFTVTKKFLMHALARRKLWFVWVCVFVRGSEAQWTTQKVKNQKKSQKIYFDFLASKRIK